MASQKVRPPVLQSFFRISTYLMYAFTPEKKLRLGGRNFCLSSFDKWRLNSHSLSRLSGTDQRSIPSRFAVFGMILFFLFLTGCQSAFLNKIKPNEFKEQYYIDAKLNFAIKHPLNWKRIKTSVSSPKYQANTVLWQIKNPHEKSSVIGNMLIQSLPRNKKSNLPDLLSHFLTGKPELTSGQAEKFEHPAGSALKLLGHDADRGRLTIALQGQQHDFIISLNYPNSRFDELLPVFQDIVASFTEIIRDDNNPKSPST